MVSVYLDDGSHLFHSMQGVSLMIAYSRSLVGRTPGNLAGKRALLHHEWFLYPLSKVKNSLEKYIGYGAYLVILETRIVPSRCVYRFRIVKVSRPANLRRTSAGPS